MEAREPVNVKSKALAPQPHSPWHSPVPYLFGGLAAMLGLIAFALLILACSYWKLSGHLDNDERNSRDRDLEAGDGDDTIKKQPTNLEEKYLVIMAGQVKPTFIATAVSSRTSSFGDSKSSNSTSSENGDKSEVMVTEVKNEETSAVHVNVHEGNLQSHEEASHD